MKSSRSTALVIGMNGGIGGAIGRALLARGLRVRALTRREQPPRDGVEWIRGDAMNPEDVRSAARGVEVIVHGANPPRYRNWRGLALPMLANSIAAATELRATLVFPGTLYNYGPDAFPLLGETSPQNPCSRKGAIRVEMERMLLDASTAGARVLLVRAGDFFGPGAGSSWFSQGLIRSGSPVRRVWYPGAHDVGHSWAYLPDLADAAARLVLRRHEFAPFEAFHFEGHWLARGVQMAEAICDVAQIPRARIGAFPWWAVRTLAPAVPMFREMLEMRYLWTEPLRLDNRKLAHVLGSEPHTDLHDAVTDTLVAHGCLGRETRCPRLA